MPALREGLSHRAELPSITIILEGALNDLFDPTPRQIIIGNTEAELQSLYFNFVDKQQTEKYVLFADESPP